MTVALVTLVATAVLSSFANGTTVPPVISSGYRCEGYTPVWPAGGSVTPFPIY